MRMASFLKKPRFRIYMTIAKYFHFFNNLLFFKGDESSAIDELEQSLKKTFMTKHAILMPQARVGIYLAIKAIVTPEKRKIILSPYTIADVINMVICAGAIPIFSDIDEKECNITPELAMSLIDDQTAAIMITHLHGVVAKCDDFKIMCEQHNIKLIEDAAQAFGARYKGKMVGTYGDIGVFSFGRYKNITSFFGGAVVSNSPQIEAIIRNEINRFKPITKTKLFKRQLGCLIKSVMSSDLVFTIFTFPLIQIAKKFNLSFILKNLETELDLSLKTKFPEEYKEKMSSVQAMLILRSLGEVEKDNHARIDTAQIYYNVLRDVPKYKNPRFH